MNLNITNIQINNPRSFFTPSPNTQSLDISDNNTRALNLLSYSYDGSYNSSPPTINSINFTNTSTAVKVTGISIYNQLDLSINTNVSNIGTFFYKSPILQYSIAGGFTVSETDLTKLITPLISINGNNSLNSTVTFTNTTVNLANNTLSTPLFLTNPVLTVIAQNALLSVTNTTTTIPNVIIDQPSFNLAFNTLKTLISDSNIDTNLTNSRASRFTSSVYGTDLSGTSLSTMNSNLIYNNDKSILATSSDVSYRAELPIVNGLFSFPSTYNSTDFTTTTGNRRYATFIWKMSTLLFASGRNTLTFEFKGTNESFIVDTGSNNVITNTTRTIVSLDFNIVISNTNTVISDTTTTSWINGALTSTPDDLQFKTGNTNNPNAVLISPPLGLGTNPIGTIVYTLPQLFITNPGTVNGYVLLRVGLPINSGFTFSNILASLTSK